MGNPINFARQWAIEPVALKALYDRIESGRSSLDTEDILPIAVDSRPGALAAGGSFGRDLAIIHVSGALSKQGDWWSASMLGIEQALREAAAAPNVGAIVLSLDSPGGTVDGTERLGAAVAEVDSVKPVVAFADGCMCSAAYWIASQSSHIVAAPLSYVGSIGVLMVHADFSAMLESDGIKVTVLRATESPEKARGNPYEALTEETKAALTQELDAANTRFHAVVASGRGKLPAAALTGAAWSVENAPAGLIDSTGRIETAIAVAIELAAGRAGTARAARLTLARKVMSEIIASTREAFKGTTFFTEAIDLAAQGKTPLEIMGAGAAHFTAALAKAEEAHAKALEAHDAAHAEALTAKDTELKAETKRADDAEARLASGGFRGSEQGSKGGSQSNSGVTIRTSYRGAAA